MPTQTTDLFLLEDLEDAGKASELAESDLDALHAVADWIKSYVVKPHKELGRAGPVSPFVPGALDRKTFWLAPEQIADRDVRAVVELQPSWAGRLAHYASARAVTHGWRPWSQGYTTSDLTGASGVLSRESADQPTQWRSP